MPGQEKRVGKKKIISHSSPPLIAIATAVLCEGTESFCALTGPSSLERCNSAHVGKGNLPGAFRRGELR